MRILVLLLSLFLSSLALARPISISGRVLSTSNVAIESPYVQFRIRISNNLSCVLYEETHNVDMTGSNGYFKIVAGSGAVSFGSNGFAVFTGNKNYVCRDGSTWVSGLSDNRRLAVSVKVDSDPWIDFSSDTINAVAYANEAETLAGKTQLDFIQSNANVTQAKIESLASNSAVLLDLGNGLSSVYATQSSLNAGLSLKEDKKPPGQESLIRSANLSDVASVAQARANLQLGAISLKNSIDSADINALDWSKLINAPTTFTPSTHTHPISDITGLGDILGDKVDKSVFNCSSTQIVQFISVTGTFSCIDIQLSGDIQGSVANATLARIQGRNVVISNPQDQDVIAYNNATSRWENRPNNLATASINTAGDITAGNITATKQIAGTTNAGIPNDSSTLNFANGNTIILSHNCSAPIDLASLKDGAVYTFVNTDTVGTSRCVFTASGVPGASIRYSPANTNRIGGGSITVYSILRASNYVLIAWSSGFVQNQ